MIKVNLLNNYLKPEGGSSDVRSGSLQDGISKEELGVIRVEFLKRFFVFLLGPIGLYLYEMQTIPELLFQRDSLQAQLSEIQGFNLKKDSIIKEIKKYEEDKKRIHDQLQVLNLIGIEKANVEKLIEKIQSIIPDGVWMTFLQIRGNTIEIKGESDSENQLNNFEADLKQSPFIERLRVQDLNLVEARQNQNQLRIKAFVISGEFNVNPPQTEPEIRTEGEEL